MDFDFGKLSLIDLISEKHAFLRKTVEVRWNQQSDIHFSHGEWHLLAKVAQQSLSISQAAIIVGVSRQAMQKTVKKLEEQGYLTTQMLEGNKRDKYLLLTPKGQELCNQNNALKLTLQQELEELLGKTEVEKLTELFRKDWELDN